MSLLNASIPDAGYTVTKNIAYGDAARQKLDVYVPAEKAKGAPVVLFLYGGSWKYGSKDDYVFVAQSLTSLGYVTVVADYRLYPEIKYPDFVVDGARALHWVHDNIAGYGGNVDNVFVMGHSAGPLTL